ncbi:hemagglutination activity domain-containing protein [Pseudomonas aeruginosa]|nr:hemagglutination activity domain-containing protein [Pseudomonas aeruginosa]
MFKTTTTAGDILSRQQTATLTAGDASRVYGDANPALTATMSGINAIDAYVNSQFNDLYQVTASTTATQASNVGQYAITGNANGSEYFSQRYQLVRQDGKLTVTPAQLIVSADARSKVYGDADPSLTYQVSGLKNGDSAGAILTGGLNRAAGENVGVYGINQGDLALNSGNYDLSYQGNNLTITKALLNVIADAKTKVYGDADPSLTYQVSGLKNGDSAGAVLNGGSLSRVAGENVGTYGINQGDLALNSGNYDLSYQGNNLTITKALLNVIADAKTKVYGDADPSLTYQVSGLKNGDSAGAVLNGGSLSRVAGENVGVYGINQGDLALTSGNYDLSYQGNNLTITKALLNVIADAKTKVYGDADPSLTYQVSGLKNGDSAGAILTGGLNRAAGENVGVYGINQGDLALTSGNYDLSYQGNNLTITKALLNVIADAKTKVYGDADPSLTYQVSGLKNGDSAGAILTGGLNRAAGENVGVYGINQGDLALNSGNYDLSYQGNNLTITKALLNVIADAKTKVYGDADPSLTYQVSGLKNGDSAGSILTGGLNRAAGENVGVYGINQGDLALNSGNYDLSYQGNNLTITKALLNVIADAKTKVYGDADPSLTYQVSGLKNGDSAGAILTGGLNRAAGENVGVYGINQGDLALNSGNYDLSYQGNNLTITKALLNVIADAKTKVYGDADPSLTYQVSGLKNGDSAGAVLNGGSLSRAVGENVGVYGINQGDLALNSGNYDLSYQGNNLTITKALLNVIADAKTKVYGDADPSLTYQVSGLKNGDSAGSILTGGLNRAAGENVGVYGINQGDLALNSGNYDLSYQGNNLTITKALLNVIADAKTKVYGDADPSLTYQVSGLKNGDSAGAILTGGLNRAAGENVGVYGINQGDLALNSGNYDLSYQGNNLTITKALLNVIADAKTKVYGDADPSLTYQVSGLKNGDSAGAILTGGLNRAAGENVGVYGINQGDLALNSGNYDLSYQGNNLTITKALLNVIADAKTKVYGDADPSLTYQVSGLKNGDSAGAILTGGLNRAAGENVGVYGINQGDLALNSGNYDLSYQGNNLTITKALLNVIADAKTKVYGDADPSLTYQVSGLKNGDSAGAILTGGLNRAAGENVGVYGINQGDLALNSGNYDLSYQGNNLTITKALLNVFADAKSKQVGSVDPALTYQVSGLKNGDSAGQVLAGGLGRVGGEAVGQYDILQGGLALTSGNYQLNYQGNLLSILPLPVNPGDLGQLAAFSDLRELQKGRDPDTPGDAVYRTTTLENPFLENPFLRAYALGDGRQRPEPAAGDRRGSGRGCQRQAGGPVHRSSAAGRGGEWGGLLEPELPGRLLELLQQASELLTLFAVRAIALGR